MESSCLAIVSQLLFLDDTSLSLFVIFYHLEKSDVRSDAFMPSPLPMSIIVGIFIIFLVRHCKGLEENQTVPTSLLPTHQDKNQPNIFDGGKNRQVIRDHRGSDFENNDPGMKNSGSFPSASFDVSEPDLPPPIESMSSELPDSFRSHVINRPVNFPTFDHSSHFPSGFDEATPSYHQPTESNINDRNQASPSHVDYSSPYDEDHHPHRQRLKEEFDSFRNEPPAPDSEYSPLLIKPKLIPSLSHNHQYNSHHDYLFSDQIEPLNRNQSTYVQSETHKDEDHSHHHEHSNDHPSNHNHDDKDHHDDHNYHHGEHHDKGGHKDDNDNHNEHDSHDHKGYQRHQHNMKGYKENQDKKNKKYSGEFADFREASRAKTSISGMRRFSTN
jgi:hypothetical protein